jgi:hypothetical protein
VTARCTGEPVSWLRLERFALGELAAADAAAVRAHVDGCPACRSCLDAVTASGESLPALPRPVRVPRAPWTRRFAVGGGLALAMAAAIVLLVRVRISDEPRDPARATVAIKGGGTLVLSLVRERGGAIALDPSSFAAGDRWKVRVTCDRGGPVVVDVAVYEPDARGYRAAFPLRPAAVTCGNDVTLPGAFRLTGARNLVCVAVAEAGAPDRERLASGPAGAELACRALSADAAGE